MILSRGYTSHAATLFVAVEATDYLAAPSPDLVPAVREAILNAADEAEGAGMMVEVSMPFDTLRVLLGVRVEQPRG